MVRNRIVSCAMPGRCCTVNPGDCDYFQMRGSAYESNGKFRIIPYCVHVDRLGSPNLIAILAMCLMTEVGENIFYRIYKQSMKCPLTSSTHVYCYPSSAPPIPHNGGV